MIATMQTDLNHASETIRNKHVYSRDHLESKMILDLVHAP